MTNRTKYFFDPDHPGRWFYLVFLVLILVAGLFIGQFVGLLLSMVITRINLSDLINLVSPPLTDSKRIPIMLIQGFSAFGGFIIGGMIYLKYIEKLRWQKLFRTNNLKPGTVIIAIMLVVAFMFVNTIFIEWNAHLTFPGFLKDIGDWAKQKEDELKTVTEFLTEFTSFPEFLLGVIVIAIIPGLGEELIFRGILQNKFHAYFKNIHVAIWLSAILFSTFHLQFFGFIPRMLLGGLFGYMYYWSGNLWFPVIAHFINNGLTLTMMYLFQTGMIKYDVASEESYPWTVLLIFAIITAYMMYSFKSKVETREPAYE